MSGSGSGAAETVIEAVPDNRERARLAAEALQTFLVSLPQDNGTPRNYILKGEDISCLEEILNLLPNPSEIEGDDEAVGYLRAGVGELQRAVRAVKGERGAQRYLSARDIAEILGNLRGSFEE